MADYFYAILCQDCGCIHGWVDHPKVTKIIRDSRSTMESIWWCPRCRKEHRTTDGSMFGQHRKAYEEIHSQQKLQEILEQRSHQRMFHGGQVSWVNPDNFLGY